MPTTTTIPYPLSSTPNGVVVYTNETEFPQPNLDYTLSLNGSVVIGQDVLEGNTMSEYCATRVAISI
jgi:hypothetical protein